MKWPHVVCDHISDLQTSIQAPVAPEPLTLAAGEKNTVFSNVSSHHCEKSPWNNELFQTVLLVLCCCHHGEESQPNITAALFCVHSGSNRHRTEPLHKRNSLHFYVKKPKQNKTKTGKVAVPTRTWRNLCSSPSDFRLCLGFCGYSSDIFSIKSPTWTRTRGLCYRRLAGHSHWGLDEGIVRFHQSLLLSQTGTV